MDDKNMKNTERWQPQQNAEKQDDEKTIKQGRAVVIVCAVLCVLVFAFGLFCKLYPAIKRSMPKMPKEDVTMISQLAYDEDEALGYTVYIKEAGVPTPFLVLTGNYSDSGNTLLLRKDVMEKLRRFNLIKHPMKVPYTYYPDSEIDKWLSEEYIKTLSGVEIVPSSIIVSAVKALGPAGTETEVIVRDAFLLSEGELGGQGGAASPLCGTPLAYFSLPMNEGVERRVA